MEILKAFPYQLSLILFYSQVLMTTTNHSNSSYQGKKNFHFAKSSDHFSTLILLRAHSLFETPLEYYSPQFSFTSLLFLGLPGRFLLILSTLNAEVALWLSSDLFSSPSTLILQVISSSHLFINTIYTLRATKFISLALTDSRNFRLLASYLLDVSTKMSDKHLEPSMSKTILKFPFLLQQIHSSYSLLHLRTLQLHSPRNSGQIEAIFDLSLSLILYKQTPANTYKTLSFLTTSTLKSVAIGFLTSLSTFTLVSLWSQHNNWWSFQTLVGSHVLYAKLLGLTISQ